MAVSEHLVKLILSVANGQAFKDLQKEAIDQRAAMERLTQSYTEGEITSDTYLKQTQRLARELDKKEKILREVERAQQAATAAQVAGASAAQSFSVNTAAVAVNGNRATGAMNMMGTAGGGLAQKVMVINYALDDLNYGIQNVSNNIPGIVSAFGMGGGGLGMALMLGSTAVSMLIHHWDKLQGMWGTEATKTEAERMEELAKATDRTAAQTIQLAGYKQGQADRQAWDALASKQSDANKDTAAAVAAAFGKVDPGEAFAELEKVFDRSIKFNTGADQARMKASIENLRKDIMGGNQSAYETLVRLVETNFGADSDLFIALSAANPATNGPMRAMVDKWQDGNNKAKQFKNDLDKANAERADLTAQGAEAYADFLEGMAKEATGKLLGVFGASNNDLLVNLRAGGVAAAQQAESLNKQVKDQLLKINPILASFPKTLGEMVKGIAMDAIRAADDAEAAVMAAEGLTRQEVQARNAANLRNRREGQMDQQTGEVFAGLAGNMDAFNRRFNPNAPAMTEQQRQAAGQQFQQHFDDLGIDRRKQKGIATTMSDPAQFSKVQKMFQSMMGAGIDEKTALERLPEIFANGNGKTLNIAAETNRQVNAIIRMNQRLFNEQMRIGQQTRDNSAAINAFANQFGQPAQRRGRQ